jgi:AraC family transcriptional regulator, transcriptional activator of pobA
MATTQRITSIAELHHRVGLPRPDHPLISVVNLESFQPSGDVVPTSMAYDFYTIALKKHCGIPYKYGQQEYVFQDGVMSFMAPGQVFTPLKRDGKHKMSGWMLYLHPDFLWNTPLAKAMRQYEFFDYTVNEALYLTEREETTIISTLQHIQTECLANQDNFSQPIIISFLEVLLNYSDRFYHRQFLSRKVENHQVLDKLESILAAYFNSDELLTKGLPSVQYVAAALNLSPNYLSTLLKVLTGRNTQQHIQDKMIEKAKEQISTTELTVSEISYLLGFEHPKSFSRLFKSKTGLTPMAFRQTFSA